MGQNMNKQQQQQQQQQQHHVPIFVTKEKSFIKISS